MSNNFSVQTLTKNRVALSTGLAAFLLTASLAIAFHRAHHDSVAAAGKAAVIQGPELVAGPGRVEPYSEDIKIGSELSGRLKSVFVEEGDTIHRGQTLAELENADYRAEVGSAKASVVAKEATLRKVINGARHQERDEAWSSVNETRAVMENAQSELRRRQNFLPPELFRGKNWIVMRVRPISTRRSIRLRSSNTRWSTITPAKKTGPWLKPTCNWLRHSLKKRKRATRRLHSLAHRRQRPA